MSEIRLGSRVKDQITGFQGIVVVISEYLHGCRRIGVIPEELREGKPGDAQFFDEPQVELLQENVIASTASKKGPGGTSHYVAGERLTDKKSY